MKGWIKLHRALKYSAIAANPERMAVWIHLLLRATHKRHNVVVGLSTVELNPGELLFGRKRFSAEIGVSENKLRSSLKVLENHQQITIKSNAKYSIISITKWQSYQDEPPANHHKTTSKSPANHQQTTTYKNVKNVKNVKNIGENKVSTTPPDKPKTERFSPPTVDQIFEYMRDRGLTQRIEAAKFFNYYESNGWMVGRTKMKSWQAAARNWMAKLQEIRQ